MLWYENSLLKEIESSSNLIIFDYSNDKYFETIGKKLKISYIRCAISFILVIMGVLLYQEIYLLINIENNIFGNILNFIITLFGLDFIFECVYIYLKTKEKVKIQESFFLTDGQKIIYKRQNTVVNENKLPEVSIYDIQNVSAFEEDNNYFYVTGDIKEYIYYNGNIDDADDMINNITYLQIPRCYILDSDLKNILKNRKELLNE